MGGFQVFYATKMSVLINKTPAKIGFIAGFILLAGVMLIFAAKLSTTTKEDQLLPDDHPFQRIINMFNNDFNRGSDTPMKTNAVVFGIKGFDPVDRDGIGRFDVASMGALAYDPTFELSTPATQQFILDLCVELQTATFAVDGAPQHLVRQSAGAPNDEAAPTIEEVAAIPHPNARSTNLSETSLCRVRKITRSGSQGSGSGR